MPTEVEIYLGNIRGPAGEGGGLFTPHISDDGELSWTNDMGKENPPPVNVMGKVPQVSFRYEEDTGLLYYEIMGYIDGNLVEW